MRTQAPDLAGQKIAKRSEGSGASHLASRREGPSMTMLVCADFRVIRSTETTLPRDDSRACVAASHRATTDREASTCGGPTANLRMATALPTVSAGGNSRCYFAMASMAFRNAEISSGPLYGETVK